MFQGVEHDKLCEGLQSEYDGQNKGIAQNELGSIIGSFSRQYITDMEHGRENISLLVARAFASLVIDL